VVATVSELQQSLSPQSKTKLLAQASSSYKIRPVTTNHIYPKHEKYDDGVFSKQPTPCVQNLHNHATSLSA